MENKGQVTDFDGKSRADILFVMKAPGLDVYIGNDGLHYQFTQTENMEAFVKYQEQMQTMLTDPKTLVPEKLNITTYRVDMKLQGANSNPVVLTEKQSSYYENYYNIAAAPEGITDVRGYEQITLKDIYTRIDCVLYTINDALKYDFIAHPGAAYRHIKMAYRGAGEMKILEDGSLWFNTPLGSIQCH